MSTITVRDLPEDVLQRLDWSHFIAAAKIARRHLPNIMMSDSVDDLRKTRALRYGINQ